MDSLLDMTLAVPWVSSLTYSALQPGERWELQTGQIVQLGWLWECRQRLITTGLLLEAAGFRSESRGGHFRSDAPASLPYWQHHTLQQRGKTIKSSAGPDSR